MESRNSYQFPFASYPAVRIVLLIVAGILMARFLSFSTNFILAVITAALFGYILFEFILRKKFVVFSSHCAAIFYCALIISVSLAFASLQNERLSNLINQAKPIELYEWEELIIKGDIIHAGMGSSGRNIFTVDVRETLFSNELMWHQRYKIRLYGDSNGAANLSEGLTVEAGIRLYEFPERRNPHEFDYGAWLNSQGIMAHGELQEILNIRENSWWISWGEVRKHVLKNVDKLFDEEDASLAKALLLGYKDDLNPDAKQQFSRAGLSHIMAVSGLHVGFVIAPFWLFIPFLWGSQKGKWLGIMILTILLFFYAGLTGFSASVSRASLMAWLLTYGKLFHKVRKPVNLTAVAAIVLLLIDPAQLFDAGFQLSFSAVFIILLVMPEARRLIPQKYHYGRTGVLITVILVSIVVQLGLFPVLIGYFGEFSLAGPVSNVLVLPLLTIVVPAGLILVLASPLIGGISQMAAIPFGYMLQWIHSVATVAGGNNFSFISLDEIPVTLFLIWLFIIFTIASVRIPKIRWKMLICLLLAMNAFVLEGMINQSGSKKLEITFLDVGQGDAIHIKTPNNKHMLVDAGRWSPFGNSGENVIVPYLEERGIDRLNAVLLSHPHADHIGGVAEIINNLHVDTIYQSDVVYESELYEAYMDLAAEKKIPVKEPSAGEIVHIDPSIRLFVVGPEKDGSEANPNNRSLAFKLIYGNTSALFSGDAEKEQEAKISARYGEFLKSDLYKAGHHGSNTSSSDSFLKYIEPDITVASLAFQNRFGHPGPQAVSRLHRYSKDQNYTSLSGAVVYQSDGRFFRKINWNK